MHLLLCTLCCCRHVHFSIFCALFDLRFRHLDHHFLKPGDSANTSISKILHFVQSVRLLNA